MNPHLTPEIVRDFEPKRNQRGVIYDLISTYPDRIASDRSFRSSQVKILKKRGYSRVFWVKKNKFVGRTKKEIFIWAVYGHRSHYYSDKE